MTEKELVKRCLKHDRNAQFELYSRFKVAMFGLCMRYAFSEEEAQDMLQEGFITVFKQLKNLKDPASLAAWVKRVMVTTALQYLRKHKKRRFTESIDGHEDSTEHEPEIEAELGAKDLIRLIQELPHDLRVVFNLYAIEGYSHKEISTQLDISESNSKVRLSRARSILRLRVERILETT